MGCVFHRPGQIHSACNGLIWEICFTYYYTYLDFLRLQNTMIMMTQIPRTTAPPPAAPIIITTPLSSPFLCAFLFCTPSSTAAELDGAVVVEEDCETEKMTVSMIVLILLHYNITFYLLLMEVQYKCWTPQEKII